MEEERIYEFYLYEAIDKAKDNLIKTNEKYRNLRKKLDEIFNRYPELQFILE